MVIVIMDDRLAVKLDVIMRMANSHGPNTNRANPLFIGSPTIHSIHLIIMLHNPHVLKVRNVE